MALSSRPPTFGPDFLGAVAVGGTAPTCSGTRVHAGWTERNRMAPHLSESARVRRAIEMALQSLVGLPDTDEIRRVREQSESLLAEVGTWSEVPPSPKARDETMRRVLSIHIGAVAAVRAAREQRVNAGPSE